MKYNRFYFTFIPLGKFSLNYASFELCSVFRSSSLANQCDWASTICQMSVKIYIKCHIQSFSDPTGLESLGTYLNMKKLKFQRLCNFPKLIGHSGRIQIQVGLAPKMLLLHSLSLSFSLSLSPSLSPSFPPKYMCMDALTMQISIRWSIILSSPKSSHTEILANTF